ncbi:MAG: hypothetical protein ABIV13_06775 [Fimbriimonadales bacterium]
MDRFLPWIAVAAGLIAVFASSSKSAPGGSRTATPLWMSLIAVAIVYALGFGMKATLPGLVEVGHGVGIGVLATFAAYFLEPRTGRSPLAAMGMATLAGGVALLLPEEMRMSVWLGMAIGGGIASACSAGGGSLGSDRLAAFLIAAVSGASALGSYRDGVDRAEMMPTLIGIIAVIALAAVNFGSLSKWVKWLIVAVILVGAAKLIAMRFLFLGASFNVALGAVITAAVVAWLLENEDGKSHGPFAIATLIWLAWSTVAFGLLQGLGLGISTVFAATFLLAAGSYRGLLSMASLVALLFYRTFLEMYPTETRQIDVGQQYAVMGIVAGVVLPIAVGSWLGRAADRFSGFAKPAIAILAGVIAVSMLIAADFVLGAEGTVGVLIGLALAPFVAGLGGGDRLGVLAAIGALAATVVATFKFAAPHLLMERADKIQILGWSIGISVVLIALAHFLTKRNSGEIHESVN